MGLWCAQVHTSLSLSLSLSLSDNTISVTKFNFSCLSPPLPHYRFFAELAKPVHRYLKMIWVIMWKWVGPIVMFIIFIASIILQLVHPLNYSVFRGVS